MSPPRPRARQPGARVPTVPRPPQRSPAITRDTASARPLPRPARPDAAATAATASARSVTRRTLARQRSSVVRSSLLIMGHQACEALVPVAIGVSVDTAIVHGSPGLLLLCLLGLVALFGVLNLCWRWAARYGYGAAIDEAHLLRAELAHRLMDPRTRPGRPRGELLSIASSDADLAAKSVNYVSGLWGAAAALAVSCAVLLSVDLRLGLVLIATSIAATLSLNALSPLLSRRSTAQQEALADASALATDLVSGLRTLQGIGAQHRAADRYREVSGRAADVGIRAGDARSLQVGATVLASGLVLVVSVVGAGVLAADGAVSVGGMIAAVGAAQFIAEPLTNVGAYLQLRAAARAGAARVAGVLAAPSPG
ncbi:ABC transporter ATP-binding protein, partial [Thermobifida halotolerans]